jgi:hypothetical protein
LAKIRAVIEQLRPSDAFFWCDGLDIQLLVKVGYQWMIKGTQIEIPTPGKNQKQYLAAGLISRSLLLCLAAESVISDERFSPQIP